MACFQGTPHRLPGCRCVCAAHAHLAHARNPLNIAANAQRVNSPAFLDLRAHLCRAAGYRVTLSGLYAHQIVGDAPGTAWYLLVQTSVADIVAALGLMGFRCRACLARIAARCWPLAAHAASCLPAPPCCRALLLCYAAAHSRGSNNGMSAISMALEA